MFGLCNIDSCATVPFFFKYAHTRLFDIYVRLSVRFMGFIRTSHRGCTIEIIFTDINMVFTEFDK